MLIHLFAPFFTGSHQRWAEEYTRFSTHQVKLFTLPGRHWKWRMHGGAVALAEQFMAQDEQPDLILTTDMLDTATFLAFTRKRTADIPVAVYFHENQLTYPWSADDEDVVLQRDRHYGWLNYTSALAADALLFNSRYHQNSFLNELPKFLQAFPDFRGLHLVDQISAKSQVVPLGLDLRAYDDVAPTCKEQPPVLLWNHRWEYDKNPETFFNICIQLANRGLSFRIVVLGKQYTKSPPIFAQARQRLSEYIIHWGYAKDFATYAQLLKQADIIPVTSRQDFFGGSAVEAMYCGAYPLLPHRLAFPEHIPAPQQAKHLYHNDSELLDKLTELLSPSTLIKQTQSQSWAAPYDWSTMVEIYDKVMMSVGNMA